jgi:predicted nucleic acid-binding protein
MTIRDEYEEVLLRPEFGFPAARVAALLAVIDRFAHWVVAVRPWPDALPDPDDEPFLAVAAASGSVLVTGNARHSPAPLRRGVVVLTPKEFQERVRREP